jgi:DNA-binding transcriptional ArsR family regulator
MSASNTRLQRLVSSERCKAESIEKYAEELRHLAKNVYDETLLRSRERFFKALGNSTRLRMIKMLAIREMCVCEIMVSLGMTQSNASHHLEMLERVGIVKKRKEGKWTFYSLAKPEMVDLLDSLFALKQS